MQGKGSIKFCFFRNVWGCPLFKTNTNVNTRIYYYCYVLCSNFSPPHAPPYPKLYIFCEKSKLNTSLLGRPLEIGKDIDEEAVVQKTLFELVQKKILSDETSVDFEADAGGWIFYGL